jgi:hypothetical protein
MADSSNDKDTIKIERIINAPQKRVFEALIALEDIVQLQLRYAGLDGQYGSFGRMCRR